MRRIGLMLGWSGGTAFLVLAMLWGPLSRAQTTTPQNVLAQGSEIVWDAPTTNADGTPLTDLERYDVALTQVGVAPDTSTLKVIPVPEPATKLPADSLLQGQPAGTYHVWCRAVDFSQNGSTWAGPLGVYWDRLVPGPPLNLRITVNVNVTVEGNP